MNGYDDEMMSNYRWMVGERHRIWQRRQDGEPQPWTIDPILRNRKFTNMFRVLDPGSQFVFQLDSVNPLDVLARLVFYRITNLPSTWYAMRASLGEFPLALDFVERPDDIMHTLDTRRKAGNPVFSGAYIIVPEPGTKNDKVEGAIRLTQQFLLDHAVQFVEASTQEERFAVLRATPGLGKFLSMQILTDWGYLQKEEPDQSFIVAGPGAIRGAGLLDPTIKPEEVIRRLAVGWAKDLDVRVQDRPLTVMDVQNTLCEFGKYARELVTPRKKTTYKASHPGVQPAPIFPQWW